MRIGVLPLSMWSKSVSDADMSKTEFIATNELPGMVDTYGPVGCVVYSKTFPVTGVSVLIIPEYKGELNVWSPEE